MLIFFLRMEIVTIVEGILFSIRWSQKEDHALDEMALKLINVEYLRNLFEN